LGASLTRTAKGFYDIRCEVCDCSRQDWLDTYDNQIKKITEQKQRAIEFDEFMHSKEVTEIVDKLPKEDVLEISGDYMLKTDDNSMDTLSGDNPYYDPQLENFRLRYNDFNKDGYGDISEDDELNCGDYSDTQNEDGSINKEGILDWLKKIYLHKTEQD